MNWAEIIAAIIAGIIGPVVILHYTRRLKPISKQDTLTFGKKVAIKTWNGTYVGADLNDDGKLFARVQHVQEWEVFEIVDALDPFTSTVNRPIHFGDKVAFKAMNNNSFVGADLDSQNELVAWGARVKEWETFRLLRPPENIRVRRTKTVGYGSFFTLQADNRKFVGCRFNIDSGLAAVSSRADEWETFIFINPDEPK